MRSVVMRTDSADVFFVRAGMAAQKADMGESFEEKLTLTFEDPHQMLMVLSVARRRIMFVKNQI